MRKRLLIGFVLLVLIAPVNGTYGQDSKQPGSRFWDEHFEQGDLSNQSQPGNSLRLASPTGVGDGPYYTHPEFATVMTATVSVPAQNTAEGHILVAAIPQFYDGAAALLILDDTGEPIYIKRELDFHFVGDFKKQTVNGTDYLTYHTGILPSGYTFGTSYVLDSSYQLVDTWTIDNGYGSDLHDFLLLDNGHAILMAYVPTPFDLTPYGGPANGTLIDIVLQEQDADKNVVFEWVASEHMPIEDTEVNLNTTLPIDYLHTNGIAVDHDGNWLLSHRNFSEITKISRQTGDIIWRMGGKGNEFTFTNDIGFFNQHNINRLENGNITLFDNGTFHEPPHSRAIEYAINEVTKTATRVWVYPDDTSQYSSIMSNIQRLANGNSMIGWGNQPKLTEVQDDGTIALELLLSGYSYRAFRFPWSAIPATAPRAVVQYDTDPTAVTIYASWNGATDISSYDVFAGPTMGSLAMVNNVGRSGFETEIPLTGLAADTCFFQVKPVHSEGSPTPFSNLMYRLDLPVCWEQLSHSYMPIAPR